MRPGSPPALHIARQVAESEEATQGGVLLPESAKEKPLTGEVVAVGEGTKGPDGTMTPISIASGSTVLYQKFSGAEFMDSTGVRPRPLPP